MGIYHIRLSAKGGWLIGLNQQILYPQNQTYIKTSQDHTNKFNQRIREINLLDIRNRLTKALRRKNLLIILSEKANIVSENLIERPTMVMKGNESMDRWRTTYLIKNREKNQSSTRLSH